VLLALVVGFLVWLLMKLESVRDDQKLYPSSLLRYVVLDYSQRRLIGQLLTSYKLEDMACPLLLEIL
jgi:hypothetical protein